MVRLWVVSIPRQRADRYIATGMTTIEHAIPVPTLYDDVLTLYALSGTGSTPTHIVNYGGAWGEQIVWATHDVPNDPKYGIYLLVFNIYSYHLLSGSAVSQGMISWKHCPSLRHGQRTVRLIPSLAADPSANGSFTSQLLHSSIRRSL